MIHAILRVALCGRAIPAKTTADLEALGWDVRAFTGHENDEVLGWSPHMVHLAEAADEVEARALAAGIPIVRASALYDATALHRRYLQTLLDAHGPPPRLRLAR